MGDLQGGSTGVKKIRKQFRGSVTIDVDSSLPIVCGIGSADFLDTSWMLNMLVNFSGCRKASWEINAMSVSYTHLTLPTILLV